MSRHGTSYRYQIIGCRCPECRKWNTDRKRVYRQTPHGRAKQVQAGRRQERIRQACIVYVRANHPEVWAQICEEAKHGNPV